MFIVDLQKKEEGQPSGGREGTKISERSSCAEKPRSILMAGSKQVDQVKLSKGGVIRGAVATRMYM